MTSYFSRRVVPFILALVATSWWTIAHADIPKNANISLNLDNEQAKIIHQSVLTIDSHIDWPIRQVLNPGFDPGIGHKTELLDSGQWDLVRMEAGSLDAAFMSIFTPQRNLTDEGYAQAEDLANQMIKRTYQFLSDHSNRAEIALTPKDAYRLKREGKRAIFLGMENGYPLGTNISSTIFLRSRDSIHYLDSLQK